MTAAKPGVPAERARRTDQVRDLAEREQLWRTVARAFYDAAGSPPLSFAVSSSARMRDTFNGGAPITPGVADRMIEARHSVRDPAGSADTVLAPLGTNVSDGSQAARGGGRAYDDGSGS